jgi:hypothetical protein
MARTDFILKDNAGAVIGILPARNRKYSKYLNNAGAASFETNLKYDDVDVQTLIDAIAPSATYVRVERDGKAMFQGEVQQPNKALSADNEAFTIPVMGHFAQLDDRFTPDLVTYTQIDQGDIAWDLINASQIAVGTFGITKGVTTTGILRDRSYEMKKISDAIRELAACEQGFDFEITPDKVFNVFYPQRGVRVNGPVFEYGKNIMAVNQAYLKPKNLIRAIGAGEGENMLKVSVGDANSISLYCTREEILSLKDVSLYDTLVEQATDYLKLWSLPPEVIRLDVKAGSDPELGGYEEGDYIRVKVDYGVMQIDTWLRIYGIEITVDDNDFESVSLITNP